MLTVSGLPDIPTQKYEIEQKWELADGGKTLKVEEKMYAGNPEIRGLELFNLKRIFQKVQDAVRD